MKQELHPRCQSCGQRHPWLGSCPEDPVWNVPKSVLWFFLCMMAVFLILFSVQTCRGAVIRHNNGFTATESFEFGLDPAWKTDVVFSFSDSRWTIGRNEAHNKNARFHAYAGVLGQMLPGWQTEFGMWPSSAVLSGLWWRNDGVPVYVAMFSNPEDDGEPEHYRHGWLRLSVTPDDSLTIHDWAYESDGDTPITVPETRVFIPAILPLALLLRRSRPSLRSPAR